MLDAETRPEGVERCSCPEAEHYKRSLERIANGEVLSPELEARRALDSVEPCKVDAPVKRGLPFIGAIPPNRTHPPLRGDA